MFPISNKSIRLLFRLVHIDTFCLYFICSWQIYTENFRQYIYIYPLVTLIPIESWWFIGIVYNTIFFPFSHVFILLVVNSLLEDLSFTLDLCAMDLAQSVVKNLHATSDITRKDAVVMLCTISRKCSEVDTLSSLCKLVRCFSLSVLT